MERGGRLGEVTTGCGELRMCCLTTSPPPLSHSTKVSSLCVQCPPVPVCESRVQIGVTGVSLVSGVCGSRGLSCSLRLLTGPARVRSPPFDLSFLSEVFVSGLGCVRDQHRAGSSRRGHREGVMGFSMAQQAWRDQ